MAKQTKEKREMQKAGRRMRRCINRKLKQVPSGSRAEVRDKLERRALECIRGAYN